MFRRSFISAVASLFGIRLASEVHAAPTNSAETPVTRAELAAILKEAGFVSFDLDEQKTEFTSVFENSPAFQ